MKNRCQVVMIGLVILSGLAGLASAEEFIRLKGNLWQSRLNGKFTAGVPGLTGTALDLRSALDLTDTEQIPEIELRLKVPMMGRVIGSYWKGSYEGAQLLPASINYAGTTFAAGQTISTELNLAMTTVLYEKSFEAASIAVLFPGLSEVEAGFLLGGKYLTVNGEITSSAGPAAEEDLNAPIPVVGFLLKFGIMGKVSLETGFTGMRINLNNLETSFLDLYADINIRIIPSLPLGIGYKRIDLDINYDGGNDIDLDLKTSGYYLSTVINF